MAWTMTTQTNPELSALIREVLEANLLKSGSRERAVAERVAELGIGKLPPEERDLFERTVLPILAKPLREQIAVASIIQRGGYVPRKIDY